MRGGDQTITISARARLRVDGVDVFAFLATPGHHHRLQVPGIRLLAVDDEHPGTLIGGVFALDGPFGLRRTARTRVTLSQPPRRLAGSAWLDSGTEAHVSWTLRPVRTGTVDVELTAVLGPTAARDRLALSLGGRHWVRARFARTLRRLAAELERAPVAAPAAGAARVRARTAGSRRITQPT
jgi:Polyketide cyclase / dehydrase and lipid transport